MSIDTCKGCLSYSVITIAAASLLPNVGVAAAYESQDPLEEIFVTAEKRHKSLQDTPIAISVIDGEQLTQQGISSLDGLKSGIIPSLRIQPFGTAPSLLIVTIRGNGSVDPSQITRDGTVAIYQDGFYLARAQGLSLELADLERIEVLRGPQGTLYGRNATSGAINVISKKPTGEFGFKQTLGYGNYDALRSVTSLNLPAFSGISLKFDYMHSERDGWVNNTAPDQSDYYAYNKDGGRLSLNWKIDDAVTLDYTYERGQIVASQVYWQVAFDALGIIGVEDGRQKTTRFDITPLTPSVTDHNMHALTATWDVSDILTIKSLTSYREIEEEVSTNYAGSLYFNGLVLLEQLDQDQFSQEIQIIGTQDRLEWVLGAYYFKENATQDLQTAFSLDSFGLITGTPLTPIPLTTFNVFSGSDTPLTEITTSAKSTALYAQATWTPPILDDRFELTVGLRYTDDNRIGSRTIEADNDVFVLDVDHWDPLVTLNYKWNENFSTYAKWSTAYRVGGASVRSASFSSFGNEEVESFEIGVKSTLWDQRATINIAIFTSDTTNAQISFPDPTILSNLEVTNAAETIEVDGAEVEIMIAPLPGLVVGLNYTYLDGNAPPQPNPFDGGALERLVLTQIPTHAGSVTVDYTFAPMSVGTLTAHIDMSATDEYHYSSAFRSQDLDSFAIFNARLTLSDIDIGGSRGRLTASLWAKNLFDTEYVPYGAPIGAVADTAVYGTPRTYGFEVTYQF